MSKTEAFKRSLLFRFLFSLVSIVLICFFLVIFADRVITLSINSFTDYKLSYDSWGENIFDKGQIEGVNFQLKDKNLVITVEKVHLNVKEIKLFRKPHVILDCEMQEVTLPDFYLSMLETGRKYDEINFVISIFPFSGGIILSDFSAVSKDITVRFHKVIIDGGKVIIE